THPDSHEYYCRLAAANGVPVIVCEKPVSDTLRGARRIAALETEYGVRIITNHERRYAEDYIAAKQILRKGTLGQLRSVKCCLYMGEKRRMLDVLWHDGTHLADALMYLCGADLRYEKHLGDPLTSRKGTAWLFGHTRPFCIGGKSRNKPDKENPGQESSELSSPLPFVFEIGAERDHLVFELEFSCTRGRLSIGNGVYEIWQSGESPYARGFRSLERIQSGFGGQSCYFTNMLKDAVACVHDRSRLPVSGAGDGLRVIEFLHSVQRWR
ncbi:MAG: gfo/Idh/MocA family oxidoreductase, partial [Spirochaetaceae bacterium]|nr:gfo/Idh/MocA family oxidoreductase [Spirochaetaceae bacterium]